MNLKNAKPLIFALSAGVLGFCWRLTLYRVGFDERNILSASHRLHIGCLVLTAITAVYLLLKVWKPEEGARFLPKPLQTVCCIAAGCLIACHGLSLVRDVRSLLEMAQVVSALGAACAMVLLALVPERLTTLRNLCRGGICAFFALDMLCRYQGWSGNPQLPDYVFQVFACILLALTSYRSLALSVGLSRRRGLVWCGLMAVYLSLLSAAGPETHIFYLSGALWAAACLDVQELPAEAHKEKTT